MRQQIIITDVTISLLSPLSPSSPLSHQNCHYYSRAPLVNIARVQGHSVPVRGEHLNCHHPLSSSSSSSMQTAKHPYFVPICGEPTQKSLMIFLGSNLACCSGPFNKNIVAMTTKINHQPWAGPSGIRNFNLGWDFCKIRGSWDFLGRDWFNIFILNFVGTKALKSLSCLI